MCFDEIAAAFYQRRGWLENSRLFDLDVGRADSQVQGAKF
jgi:hypothetical protein